MVPGGRLVWSARCAACAVVMPLVATETTIPGRASAPTSLLMYSLSASAPHCERSSSRSRRFRNMPRSSRGMVKTTWR